MKVSNQQDSNRNTISRRQSLGLLGGLSAMALTAGCQSPAMATDSKPTGEIAYDLKDPKDQLLIFEKLKGDVSGTLTYGYSEGRVFGIRPDQPEDLNTFGKEVFRFTGCGLYKKRILDNGDIETKSKAWLLYQNPDSGAFIEKMTNPYTGEEVEVPPFRAGIRGGVQTPNGPKVDANFSMESTAFGGPLNLVFNFIGDNVHVTRHAFTKWFEKKSQTWRTEMTMDTYDFDIAMLYDRDLPHIPSHAHWTSQTAWLSILKMAGTPGHMIWTTNGCTLYDIEDIPSDFIAATKVRQPDIFAEPLTWDS